MRNFMAMVVFGSALSLFGYTTVQTATAETEAAKPLIRCSTCGVEFTSPAGLTDHLKSHPDHKAPTE